MFNIKDLQRLYYNLVDYNAVDDRFVGLLLIKVFKMRPVITRVAASSFHHSKFSFKNSADALIPKTGTSSDHGVTIAAG